MSGVRIKGLEKVRDKLERINKIPENKSLITRATLLVERVLKKNAPKDRGIMRNSITNNVYSATKARVLVGAEHGIYQNEGFTVRAGHVFYDRKTKSFKRIKETKFIEGRRFAEKTVEETKDEIMEMFREEVKK